MGGIADAEDVAKTTDMNVSRRRRWMAFGAQDSEPNRSVGIAVVLKMRILVRREISFRRYSGAARL